jgi:hypothetical protein
MAILELPPVKWELTKVKKIESNGDGIELPRGKVAYYS